MSADLFAEFGFGPSTNPPSNTTNQRPATSHTSQRSLIPDLDVFEDATPPKTSGYGNDLSSQSAQIQTEFSQDFGDFQQPRFDNSNEVLFDATFEQNTKDDIDDWGEFESAEIPSTQSPTKRPVQTHRTVYKPKVKPSQGSKSPTAVSKNLNLVDALSMENKSSPTHSHYTGTLLDDEPVTQRNDRPRNIPVQDESFEEWPDFVDGPVTQPKPMGTSKVPKDSTSTQPSDTGKVDKRVLLDSDETKDNPQNTHIRPINIPPPSILLELFPRLFEQLRQTGIEAKKNAQHKENSKNVALSIICTLRAAARVVAGRTLRWKRDAILSQSMRIGPARAGKPGGMKLSTVNKNETIKEKQEAVDVIDMWRDRAAFFNSIIQAAGKRPVQIILENARVTTQQGALKASHACALCGLKRDERLPKIDETVEDSFGEWWTDHWGHTDCRQFWEANMNHLDQR